jgi:excisionase family DNA binding protein
MKILTTQEVAGLLQTSIYTVERLIRKGDIPAERLTPKGQYRILENALQEYAQRRGVTLQQAQK